MASDDTHEDDDGPMLSKSMSRYFASSEFSDMKIKCGDTVHAVHRAIVCGQSSFFANAMKQEHGFKEAQTNTVELNHDHPATIKAMLEYMYLAKYSDVTLGAKLEERVSLHIDVYSIADKYGVGGLRKHAAGNIKDLVNAEDASHEVLARVIDNVYEKTPENDQFLRPLMIKTAFDKRTKLIRDMEFFTKMESVPGFNAELIKVLVAKNDVVRYTCPGCREAYHLILADTGISNQWGTPSGTGWGQPAPVTPAEEETYCPGCGDCYTNSTWRSRIIFS